MNVRCTGCQTLYRVDPAKVPAGGVRARCSVCGAVFRVEAEVVADDRAHPMVARSPDIHARPGFAPSAAPPSHPAPAAVPRPSISRPGIQAPPPGELAPPAPDTAAPVVPPEPPVEQPSGPAVGAPGPSAAAPVEPAAPPEFEPAPAPEVKAAPPPVVEPAPAPVVESAPPPVVESPPPSVVEPAPAPVVEAAPPPAAEPAPAPVVDPGPPPVAEPAPSPAPPPAARPSAPINPFMVRDPKQKAKRLARALISDMMVYHPDKRREGLERGTLKEIFEEEIKKSWEEYVEQVGKEMAESTPFFTEALNELLAGGRSVF